MSLPFNKFSSMTFLTSRISGSTKTIVSQQKFNTEIIKLCRENQLKKALGILYCRDNQNLQVECNTYISLIQACTDKRALSEGKSLHTHMLSKCLKPDIYLSTKLISMYVMCQSVEDARQVFDKMPARNVLSWNAILRGYIRNGMFEETFRLYHRMLKDGIQPDRFTIPYVLKACSGMQDLHEGEKVHDLIVSIGLESDVVVGSSLIDMYAKCGSLEHARQVFDKIPERDIVTWSAMIGGFSQNGDYEKALKLFRKMMLSGVQPDAMTIASVLPACAGFAALQEGKQVHGYITRRGFKSDIYVLNALIDVYAKCGSMEDGRQVFDKMSERDSVSWSSVIVGHSQNGYCYEALKLFCDMRLAGVKSGSAAFAGVFSTCAELGYIKPGKEIHNCVVKSGLELDVFVASALVDMYSKCGSLEIARRVFDQVQNRDLVLWNSMIAAYAQNGHCKEALEIFNWVHQAGLKPNLVTLVSILPACGYLERLHKGREVHAYIVKGGFQRELVVGCALINMYAKCGIMDSARLVFDRISSRHVELWNSIICGYAQNGFSNEAFELFRRIQQLGMKPDSVTLTSILPAFTHLANLQKGKEMHDYIIRNGFDAYVSMGNALIDMYAKCGSIKNGHTVFNKMCERDVVSWNAIIAGYGLHGHCKDAFNLFHQMQQTDMQPDYITFVALLSACSRAGLVDKGWEVFESMNRDHQLMPRMEHYACMVDLLGRAGRLDQARDFIEKFPQKPGADVWGSLLGACRVHHNIEIAEFVAEQLFELKPDNAGYYVLLSNIYATAGRWVDVKKVRALMKDRGVKKKPGCSWIEAGNSVHSFIVGERSHPQSEKMYAMLEGLTDR